MRDTSVRDEALLARRSACVQSTLAYDEPILFVRGEGAKLYDESGREWLDCVNNVVAAQTEQLQLLNTNSRYLGTCHAQYTTALLQTLPDHLSRCMLCNSGSEANDLALQMARAARPAALGIAVLEGAYHGHVSSMMECSPYKFWGQRGVGRPAHVHVVRQPDGYRRQNLDGRQAARAALCAAAEAGIPVGVFFCESAVSCGGQFLFPDGWLADAFAEMQQHGVVCVADEVQLGFGRLGDRFWGFETQGVQPDIVVMGKAMGNGFPLAGLATTEGIASTFAAGPLYFNTFAGNNAACASGLAVLRVLKEQGLQEHALSVGKRLLSLLRKVQEAFPDDIGDVRGQGLFIGIELVTSARSCGPAPGKAKWIKERMKKAQVLMTTDGLFSHVLKIKPPMVFSTANAEAMCACLHLALSEMQDASTDIDAMQADLMAQHAPGQKLAKQYFAQQVAALRSDEQHSDTTGVSGCTHAYSAASSHVHVPAS